MKAAIRKYTEADKQNCLVAFKSNVPLYFTRGEVNEYESFLDRLPQPVNTKNHVNKNYYFIIEFENHFIGCGGFGDKDNKNVMSLAWGLIHKDFHSRGFGKQLLLYRLNQLEAGYPDYAVCIDTTQHAYRFFERFGFSTTRVTHDFYAAGLHRYDMQLERKHASSGL